MEERTGKMGSFRKSFYLIHVEGNQELVFLDEICLDLFFTSADSIWKGI